MQPQINTARPTSPTGKPSRTNAESWLRRRKFLINCTTKPTPTPMLVSLFFSASMPTPLYPTNINDPFTQILHCPHRWASDVLPLGLAVEDGDGVLVKLSGALVA